MTTDIKELAARVEALDGDDLHTRVDIALALGWTSKAVGQVIAWYAPGDPHMKAGPPQWLTSIDAAMTLVPEGCGWMAGWGQTLPDEPMGGAAITRNARFIGYDANYDRFAEGEAATPALALTAAALRAISRSKEG